MARKVTIEKFRAWIADEANVEVVLETIAGGLTLQKTAVALKQPYTCLHAYFHETPEREARYLAARKSWADRMQDEALEIADTVPADKDEVAKAKLRVEVRDLQAKAYHRERWGERLQVDAGSQAPADEKLLGFASELLKLVKQRETRVIEIEPGQVSAEPPSVALPAPAVGKRG